MGLSSPVTFSLRTPSFPPAPALVSGEFAADAINQALDAEDFSAATLKRIPINSSMRSNAQARHAFYTEYFSFGKLLKNTHSCVVT